MKITAWTLQRPMSSPKVVQSNISQWHKKLSEKLGFSFKKIKKSKTLVNFFKFDQTNMNYPKSKNITPSVFFKWSGDFFVFFDNLNYFDQPWTSLHSIIFPTFSKWSFLVSLAIQKTLILYKLTKDVLMKITTWIIKTIGLV